MSHNLEVFGLQPRDSCLILEIMACHNLCDLVGILLIIPLLELATVSYFFPLDAFKKKSKLWDIVPKFSDPHPP